MSKKEQMHLYEGMYIFSSTLSDDATQTALEKITSSLEAKGGKIEKVHDQGRKKLAYEIGGHKQGHYYLLYFTVPSSAIDEMWREYALNEDLIRYMTMRTEKVMETVEFKPLTEQVD